MRLLFAVTLFSLVACGGADVNPQSRVAPSSAPSTPATADDAREGCAAFTELVDKAENNEVYDPATEVLQVYVGQQRYVLSPAAQECRDNPLVMNRLRIAAKVHEENRATATPLPKEGVHHVLYSHCGVVSTTVNGTLWLAEPPLKDDSNNPPAGWDENDTPGLFVQQTATEATFRADTGVEARFTKADPGASDPAVSCE